MNSPVPYCWLRILFLTPNTYQWYCSCHLHWFLSQSSAYRRHGLEVVLVLSLECLLRATCPSLSSQVPRESHRHSGLWFPLLLSNRWQCRCRLAGGTREKLGYLFHIAHVLVTGLRPDRTEFYDLIFSLFFTLGSHQYLTYPFFVNGGNGFPMSLNTSSLHHALVPLPWPHLRKYHIY